MKRHELPVSFIFLFVLLPGCYMKQKEHHTATEHRQLAAVSSFQVNLLWRTPPKLSTPESVIYDDRRDVIYVANMGGNNPTEKDRDGFISRLSPQGEILELRWIDKLNDPRGMGIVGSWLYVTDVTEILKIDIAGAKVAAHYPVQGAKFLNDMDVDSQGTVYFTDMRDNKVYALQKETVKLLSDSRELKSPNGLYFDNGRLLVGCSGYMLAMNPANGRLTRFIENTGSIDGLEKYDSNRYIITDWSGMTHLVQPNKEKILLLNTKDEKINAADLEYIPQKKVMLIPTFSDNRVMAYKISEGK